MCYIYVKYFIQRGMIMKCPNCNAEITGKFCEYCGSEMPKEQNQQNITGQNVTVINNYYNENLQDEEDAEEEPKEELLPESKLGLISLILSILGFLFSFVSFGFGILFFIPTLICASISLLKTGRKRNCTKISFAIFLLSIFINLIL